MFFFADNEKEYTTPEEQVIYVYRVIALVYIENGKTMLEYIPEKRITFLTVMVML